MIRYLFLVPRYLKRFFYLRWNRLKLLTSGVCYGKDVCIFNKTGIIIHSGATVVIGDHFRFVGGDYFNPLSGCRGGVIYCSQTGKLEIGDYSGASSTCIWCINHIKIGNHVKLGADVVILDNDAHNLDYMKRRISHEDIASSKPIDIGDDVLIGARSIVLKGVRIGARSIIGAGSVVSRDIPEDCIAAGNPCQIIKRFNQEHV